MTSDKAWRTEGGRRSDMVREERQENGNPRCKSVRCALAEERGPEGEVRWMLWSEGTSRKQTKTESLKEASTPLTPVSGGLEFSSRFCCFGLVNARGHANFDSEPFAEAHLSDVSE